MISRFLNQPFLTLSEKTIKIRRNLNVTALISLSLTTLGLSVESVSVLGVKINGLSSLKLEHILFAVLVYYICYFAWCTYDEYWKWRLCLIKENTDDHTKRATEDVSLSPAQRAVDFNLEVNEAQVNRVYENMKNSLYLKENYIDKEVVEILIQRIDDAWRGRYQSDLARLNIYEKSFRNYHWQEILRFSIFECGIPMLMALYAARELYMVFSAHSS